MIRKIDAHQHFWRYSAQEYGWISESMGVIRRDFLPEDLARERQRTNVDGSVAVEARQTLEETEWLLSLAAQDPSILAVVGWAPIAEPMFPQSLALLQQNEKLKGLRHLVQAEPAGFLFGDAFNRGIAAIGETSLIYEILIYERQLRESIAFVDRHPQQQFVLDHIAKPRIAAGEIDSWAQSIRELSLRENVVCKLSGMVTEADWKQWHDEDLAPYVDVVLDAFGSQRLMWGSDWPVCLVASSYERWVKFVEQSISKLSDNEQADILGRTAARTYGLNDKQ